MAEIETKFVKNLKICEDFAKRHNINLKLMGYVGFCRPAVGFTKDNGWITFNPGYIIQRPEFKYVEIEEAKFDGMHIPRNGVPEAWHKDEFFCVVKKQTLNMFRGEDEEPDVGTQEDLEYAVEQLATWCKFLDEQGKLSVVKYDTHEQPFGLMLGNPAHAYAMIVDRS